MAATGVLKLPVFVEFAGKKIEIGAIEVPITGKPGGRVATPTPREIKAALRKVVR